MEYLLLCCFNINSFRFFPFFIKILYTIQDYFVLFIFTMYKMLRYTNVFSISFIRFLSYTGNGK